MDFYELLLSAGAVLFVIFFIGLCIFVHELGHFLAARMRGLHIDAFSIGFKPFRRKKINGVEYRLGYLPFGGYVELPQVDATDEVPKAADGTELPRAKPMDRIVTAFCGPFFNILFGLLLGCVVWHFGIPQDSPKMRAIEVWKITENGPEYAAGLRAGDKIVRLNGAPFFETWVGFVQKLQLHVGEATLEVERNGKTHTVRYVPAVNPEAPSRLRHEQIAYPFFTPKIPIMLYPRKGGPADKAGIQPGDLLLSVDGTAYDDFEQLQIHLAYAEKPLKLEVERAGKNLFFDVSTEPMERVAHLIPYQIGVMFSPNTLDIAATTEKSPARLAGILPGDRVCKIDGVAVTSVKQVQDLTKARKGAEMELELERAGKPLVLRIAAVQQIPREIGVSISLRDYPTPIQQFTNVLDLTWKSMRGMGVWAANKMGMTQQQSTIQPRHMSGILGMSVILFSIVRFASFMTGLYFVVLISFALAIFNLLPLPVLDGGHITFAFYEMIFRKPLPRVLIRRLSTAFVVLLIGLMVYVTYYDILRTYRIFSPIEDPPKELKQEKPEAKP